MDRSNVKEGPVRRKRRLAHARRESPSATIVWTALIVEQDAASAVWFADRPGEGRDKCHHAHPGVPCALSDWQVVEIPVRSFRCTNWGVRGRILTPS